MRRLFPLLATLLLGLVLLFPAPAAGAEWCDTDPLVVIRTPRGMLVPVYVTSGALGIEHQPAVLLAAIDYTVKSLGVSGTQVRMTVRVPDDAFATSFPTRTVASSGPFATGIVYDRADGVSGEDMVMTFTLDVP